MGTKSGSGRQSRMRTNTGCRSKGGSRILDVGSDAVQRVLDRQEETRERKRTTRANNKRVTLPQFNLPPMVEDDDA